MVWRKHAMVQLMPHQKYCNYVYVPVTQVLPVHPVKHWHLLSDTQDPRLLSHPGEQVAVK